MTTAVLSKIGGTQGHGTFEVVDVDGVPQIRINGSSGQLLPSFTVATAPSASPAGQIVFVSNGSAGTPCVAVSDGTDWLVMFATSGGTAISAT